MDSKVKNRHRLKNKDIRFIRNQMLEEFKDVLREGLIIAMQNTVYKAIIRTKRAMYTDNPDFLKVMESQKWWQQ